MSWINMSSIHYIIIICKLIYRFILIMNLRSPITIRNLKIYVFVCKYRSQSPWIITKQFNNHMGTKLHLY